MQELKGFLDETGRLLRLPAKRKKRLYALWYLAEKMEPNRRYAEKEMNAFLNEWHVFSDPATLRRELYDNYLVDRLADGSAYWRREPLPTPEAFLQNRL